MTKFNTGDKVVVDFMDVQGLFPPEYGSIVGYDWYTNSYTVKFNSYPACTMSGIRAYRMTKLAA